MASRTRDTKEGSNISFVHTPPNLRGKGYGGSATAFACEDVFKDGKKICFLSTDLRNPISNKVYQKIGFTPWCDSQTFSKAKNFIQFRQATADDFDFVKSLHHKNLREYVEPIWGWDESKQDKFIRDWFKPEKIQIIRNAGVDVGLLVVEDRQSDLFLGSISTVQSKQGLGIGAAVIRGVMDQASKDNRPLRLQVLKTNPKARRLYERLGFKLEKETQNHFEFIFQLAR